MFRKLRLFLFLPLLLGLFGCSSGDSASNYETQVIKRVSDFNKSKLEKTMTVDGFDYKCTAKLDFIKYIDYGSDDLSMGRCGINSQPCMYAGGATVEFDVNAKLVNGNRAFNGKGVYNIQYMFSIKYDKGQKENIKWMDDVSILDLVVGYGMALIIKSDGFSSLSR